MRSGSRAHHRIIGDLAGCATPRSRLGKAIAYAANDRPSTMPLDDARLAGCPTAAQVT